MLISAASGERPFKERSLAVLADPGHVFVYNPFLQLEVLLKTKFHKRDLEGQFYESYFKSANCYGDLNRMFEIGGKEAYRHGIAVIDAMHIASANLMHCDILVTLEKTTKPMFRTKLVKVVSLR